ncbi:hypothetical protein [Candidatus Soleaferrea massiliensis]|uniref:hypothetical protein n=1 Tax=Candidatus Soleaferrea massiliensis TaxID=1470354 RepID=UPI00058F8CE2|nr:hypothetical protein [Candidatus Soleaferrea massiliensis]
MENSSTNTKRSLIATGLSLLLCIAMLIGTTLAWFSDTVSNKGNRIQAGNLQIEMYKYTGPQGEQAKLGENWTPIDNETKDDFIFGEDFKTWEPGMEKTIYLAVKNAGTLNLKYNLDLTVNENNLADALLFGAASSKDTAAGLSAPAAAAVSSVIEDGRIAAVPNGQLDESEVEYIALTIKFGESAGNTYQNALLDLDVILTATQMNGEITKAYEQSDIERAAVNSTIILMKDITLDSDVTLGAVNLDTGAYELNLGSHSLIFADTQNYTTVDVVGKFTSGTIVLDNAKGHFNLTGLPGTDADLNIQDTDAHSAYISGTWGNITANTGGAYEGTNSSKADSAKANVIIRADAVVQDVTANGGGSMSYEQGADIQGTVTGNLNSTDGYPFDAIFLNPGDNLATKLNASNAPDGSVIYLREGTYNVGATISISTSITVIGEGNVVIQKQSGYSDGNRHVINCTSSVPGRENRIKVVFKNITVDGGRFMSSGNKTTAGIQSIRNAAVYLYDVKVLNCTAGALLINAKNTLSDNSLTDAYIFADGLYTDSGYFAAVDGAKGTGTNAYFYYNNWTRKETLASMSVTKVEAPAEAWPNPWA